MEAIGQIVSELLAQALAGTDQTPPEPLRWISKDMGAPLVDIDDKDALYAVLDEDLDLG